MSTQTNAGGKVSVEASSGDLVFGDDPQSSLAIPKALMTQLWESVSEGTRNPSQKGGVEVGGLLVGPKAAGGKVVVDAIIPLPIEYRFGSLYQMSVFDLPNIAPAIRAVQDDPSQTVVGFYRSRICDDKTLRPSDREVFEAIEATHPSFSDFRCCFILAPAGESEAQACVAMRSGTSWNETPAFSLRRDPLTILPPSPSTVLQQLARNMRAVEQSTKAPVASSPAAPPAVESPVAPPVPQNTVAAESRAVQPDEAKSSGIQRARVWVYAVVGVLAVVVAIAYFSGGKAPPPPPAPAQAVTPRFGFSATFESPVWRLSWNRAAMEDLKPVGAVLSIQDGAVQQELPLAAADLASGTIFYTPQFGDLNFGLKVDLGGTFAEEHVRVLGAPDLAQKPGQKSAPLQTAVQAGVTAPVVAPAPLNGQPNNLVNNPVNNPTNDPSNKQIPAATASPAVPSAPAPPVRQDPKVFAPVIASKEPAKAPEREIISAAPPVLQPTTMAFAIPVPPAFEPPRPTPAQTTPAAGTPAIAGAPPAASAGTSVPNPTAQKSTYVGPRPTKQVGLQIPANVSSGVTQVQVMVEIDARGKVTKANPVGWNSTNAALMGRAVRAAQDWVFEPAQANGRAIASQMILTFRVDGASR